MTNKYIVIMLDPNDPSLGDWICISETNSVLQSVKNKKLQELKSTDKECTLYVIVPGQDVLLTHVILPKLSRSRLLQAIPFALEEQLIDDLDELHFAIGEQQLDGTLPVAIVAKGKMNHWISTLQSAGLEATAFIPAMLAIPFLNDHPSIYYYKDKFYIVRTHKYAGFTSEKETLDHMLNQASHNINTWDDNFTRIAKELPTQTYINLLQKPYTGKRKSSHIKNVWKYTIYFAIAWASIALLSNLISFFILHSQANQVDRSIEKIYFNHFPNSKSLTAPRERMQTKLKESTNASQKNNFLGLLSLISKTLSQSRQIHLQTLDYRNGQFTLEVLSNNFDSLDTLTHELNQQSLTVKLQNSTTLGSRVKATMIINAGIL